MISVICLLHNSDISVCVSVSVPQTRTEGDDDGAGDAVGHHHREDIHHPGVRGSELEFVGLMLRRSDTPVSRAGSDTHLTRPSHLTPPHPLDVAAVGSRAGQAQPDHVHEQTGDPQQVHGVPDEGRGNDVVDEERSVVRQEDASDVEVVVSGREFRSERELGRIPVCTENRFFHFLI